MDLEASAPVTARRARRTTGPGRVAGALAVALALVAVAAAPVNAAGAPDASPRGVPAGPVAGHAAGRTPLGRLTLPEPTGPDRIGTVSLHLVDRARTDPWLPSRPPRELMVQLWYPAASTAGHPVAPWLSPGAVPHFEQSLAVPPGVVAWPATHAHVGAPVDRDRRRPVVLYSPGLGSDRALGTVLVEDLASHGYVVVAIDHTHDASEVEFPGGRVETGALPADVTDAVVEQALAVREADSRFVLDQLAAIDAGRNPDAEHRRLPSGLRGALDLSRTGMFGHSLGGATAAATVHDDARVVAGIDLDGTLFGEAALAGSDRPFLLLGSDQGGGPEDPSWDAFWENQRGWKLELELAGSTHASFTDVEVLLPQVAPFAGLPPDQVTQAIGPLDPARAVRVERAYVRAFFDLHLRHRDGHLLGGPSPRYPQIRFVR